jgi:hypothetical protein
MVIADPVQEGRRLVAAADDAGIAARLVGGVAIRLRAPCIAGAVPPRTYHDIDLAAERKTSRELIGLLETQGYEPQHRFNTLAGDRLLFVDAENQRRLDVFLDHIEMCHTLEFRERLTRDPETLCLADLVLSKLQIVQLTDRDVIDLAALFAEHGPGDGDGIDLSVIEQVCCADWGWWRTVTGNLRTLVARWSASERSTGPDLRTAAENAAALLDRLERAPKTLRWKVRARVGERATWYQEPEEVR